MRDLYRFLDASLKWNVPIWIGEGGSNPVANSIFYEIAGTYDIGYAVWSWNCKVTEEQIDFQTEALKEMGMGGAHIHYRTGWF